MRELKSNKTIETMKKKRQRSMCYVQAINRSITNRYQYAAANGRIYILRGAAGLFNY